MANTIVNVKATESLETVARAAIANNDIGRKGGVKALQQCALFVIRCHEETHGTMPNNPAELNGWLRDRAGLVKPELPEAKSPADLRKEADYTTAKALIASGRELAESIMGHGHVSADFDYGCNMFRLPYVEYIGEGWQTFEPKRFEPMDGYAMTAQAPDGKQKTVRRSAAQYLRATKHRKAVMEARASGKSEAEVGKVIANGAGTSKTSKLTATNAIDLLASALAKAPFSDELAQHIKDSGLLCGFIRQHPELFAGAMITVHDDKDDKDGLASLNEVIGKYSSVA